MSLNLDLKIITWDCDECEAMYVDEVGDVYCLVDGGLIEELDECPEMEE